jgi:hypothetical protein
LFFYEPGIINNKEVKNMWQLWEQRKDQQLRDQSLVIASHKYPVAGSNSYIASRRYEMRNDK